MTIQTLAITDRYVIQWDDAADPAARAVATAVRNVCEADLDRLGEYLPVGDGDHDVFRPHRIVVQVLNVVGEPGFGAADNHGYRPGSASFVHINPYSAPGVQITDDYAGFLLVAEVSELMMGMYGWNEASSQGEALSRVLAELLHPASTGNFVNNWLAGASPRQDWINRDAIGGGIVPPGDRDPIAYGCGIVFINYLRSQLGYSLRDICGAGGHTLADRYRNLTGRADDPALRLDRLLAVHLGTGPVALGGNDPFPLDAVTIHGVLLVGGFRTHRQLMSMSADDRRNTLIVELVGHSSRPVGHFQAMSDRELAGAGAVMVYLRAAGFRNDDDLRKMSDDDQRNTLIVEIGAQTGRNDLQALDNVALVLAGLQTAASPIRAVLSIGGIRSQAELQHMSADDQRNTLIVELAGHSSRPVAYYQSLDDQALAGSGAVMVYLRRAGIRRDDELAVMSDDDQRNTLIVEIRAQTGRSDLQALSNLELVQVGLL